jgi:hypothetical protein
MLKGNGPRLFFLIHGIKEKEFLWQPFYLCWKLEYLYDVELYKVEILMFCWNTICLTLLHTPTSYIIFCTHFNVCTCDMSEEKYIKDYSNY